MKTLKQKLEEKIPTLVVFQHVGEQDASEMKFLVEELQKQYDGKAAIVRVDASYDGNLKEIFKLQEYPTWILFKEGQELMRESGKKSVAQLTEMVNTAL